MAPPSGASTSDDDKLIGRRLGGKYVVRDRIGRGGFGAVYRAVQEPVGREVAIKVILPERAVGPGDIVARFFREAKALAKLKARNAVTLYDYGEEDDGLLFMVQEFIDGRTLRSLLKAENRALDPRRAIDLACQVLDALEEAHQLDIVHRDITPSNIMITDDAQGREVVKVLDFGLAKLRGTNTDEESLTRSGIAMGTPHYMAPEQILQRDIDPRTDLYGLGIVIYLMLMGRPPFRGKIAYEVLKQQIKTPPPAMAGIPEPIESAVMQALSKDPNTRYPSAGAMREALQAALDASAGELAFQPLMGTPRRADEPYRGPGRTGDSLLLPSGRVARTAAGTPNAMGQPIDLDEGPIREEGLSAAPTHDYTPLVGDLLSASQEYPAAADGRLPAPLYEDEYAADGYHDGYSGQGYEHGSYNEPGYEHGSYNEPGYEHGSYNEPGYAEHGSYNQPGYADHGSYNQPGYDDGYAAGGYEEPFGGYDYDRSLSDPVDMGPRPDQRGGIGPVVFGLLFVAGVAAGVAYLLGVV